MRYYVIADPHGFYTYLVEALKEKGFFEDKEPHTLIVCGDLLDRGKEAIKMQDFICDLIAKDQVILIKGNHEDLFQNFLSGIWNYAKQGYMNSHHYSNGTVDSCLQLTNMNMFDAEIFVDSFADKIKNTEFYKIILPKMVDYYETNNYIFTHGWIPCVASGYGGTADSFKYDNNWRNLGKEDWQFARWYNGMLAYSQGVKEPNKTIVCGHWHCSYGHAKLERKGSEFGTDADFSPFISKGIIALDACTVISKKVNCIVIEESKQNPKEFRKNS